MYILYMYMLHLALKSACMMQEGGIKYNTVHTCDVLMSRTQKHDKPCSFPPMYKSTGVKLAAAGEISCESLVGSR